jgi:hypothetical protein
MVEEKYRVIHSKESDMTYHYRYNCVSVSKYVYRNEFEGIMVVYDYNVFNLKNHHTETVK